MVYRENIAFVGRDTSIKRLNRFSFCLCMYVWVCVCLSVCVSLSAQSVHCLDYGEKQLLIHDLK